MGALKTVVIAEDEFAIAKAMQVIVRKNFDFENIIVASNGTDAWKAIQNNDVQLVLSDWNMPGLTGGDLLQNVRSAEGLHNLPFIMLTARSDKESVIEAVKLNVSGYVHKPFDRESLIKKIKQVLGSATNNSEQASETTIVDDVVSILKSNEFSLPMMSNITSKIQELIETDRDDIDEIAKIIHTDPSLTSRILAVANSPTFRRTQRCDSIEEAVKRLGLNEVMNYVNIFSNSGVFKNESSKYSEMYKKLFQHSVAVAQAAKLISTLLKMEKVDGYYTFGLLHDIGKVLVLNILEQVEINRPIDSETKILEAVESLHEKFGQVLLSRWNYSEQFQDIALFHDSLESAPKMTDELLVIHLANRIARHVGYSLKSENADEPLSTLKSTLLLNITPEQLEDIVDDVNLYVSTVQSLMQ